MEGEPLDRVTSCRTRRFLFVTNLYWTSVIMSQELLVCERILTPMVGNVR